MNRARGARVLLLAGALALAALPARAATETFTIHGGFLFTTCLPTKAPAAGTTTPWTCSSASTTNGGITGTIVGRFTGTVDMLSGNASGSTEAWFYGTSARGFPLPGGLQLRGTSSLDGTSGGYTETANIVGGSCWFAGATGTIRFSGYLLGPGGGYGGYTATITRPVSSPAIECQPYRGVPVP